MDTPSCFIIYYTFFTPYIAICQYSTPDAFPVLYGEYSTDFCFNKFFKIFYNKTQLDIQVLYKIFIVEESLTFICTKYKHSQIANIFSANSNQSKVFLRRWAMDYPSTKSLKYSNCIVCYSKHLEEISRYTSIITARYVCLIHHFNRTKCHYCHMWSYVASGSNPVILLTGSDPLDLEKTWLRWPNPVSTLICRTFVWILWNFQFYPCMCVTYSDVEIWNYVPFCEHRRWYPTEYVKAPRKAGTHRYSVINCNYKIMKCESKNAFG